MIQKDQPTCFPSEVLVAVSSVEDGTMLDRAMGVHDGSIVSNRTKFCDQIGIDYGDVVYQRIIYGPKRDYRLLCEVDDGSTTKYTSEVVADGLITSSPGVAMMLPVADCVATVLYDPTCRRLSLLHLGRHSTIKKLIARAIKKFVDEGSRVEDIIVWMSPSAQGSSYVLDYFDLAQTPEWTSFCDSRDGKCYIDMQGFNSQICLDNGVLSQNIHVSPIDTVTSSDYFSHSAGDTKGRFAVVTMLR